MTENMLSTAGDAICVIQPPPAYCTTVKSDSESRSSRHCHTLMFRCESVESRAWVRFPFIDYNVLLADVPETLSNFSIRTNSFLSRSVL